LLVEKLKRAGAKALPHGLSYSHFSYLQRSLLIVLAPVPIA